MQKEMVFKRHKINAAVIIQTLAALILTLAIAFPVYWIFVTSFKSDKEILSLSQTLWPESFRWENFAAVFERIPLLRYFFNTLVVTVCHMALQFFIGVPAAYAFARGRFKGRDLWFTFVLGAMMIPGQVTFLPLYRIIANLGLVDTYAGLVLPGSVSAYFIFMMRQNFRSVDQSYLDAGRVDGLGIPGTLRYILLPMCRPAVMAMMLISFINGWNDYFWPKILCQSDDTRQLTVGLVKLRESWSSIELLSHNNVIFAAVLMSVLPIIILFFANQKHIMTGYSKAALK